MAELKVGLVLAITRNMPEGDRHIRSGPFNGWWPELYSLGLHKRTAGIVGMGLLGKAVAERLRGFGMELLYADRFSLPPEEEKESGLTRTGLLQLIESGDVIIPLLPLTEETFHLFNEDILVQMKKGSYRVNACRGSVADEKAVVHSLKTGHLAGYAADIFEMEDWIRPDRPRSIPRELLDNSAQTFFTPHLGAAVDGVRIEIERYCADSILPALAGEVPEGKVNDIR